MNPTFDENTVQEPAGKQREWLAQAPSKPGVYLMKNSAGEVIYVGKAKHLKRRLSGYFARKDLPDLKTGILIQQVVDLETIITASEKEALILESNLIKQYRPRYNVILKDDKRYPSLCLDTTAAYPYLAIVRKRLNDGKLYFGPYASSSAVAQTVKIINKTFKLRKCRGTDVRKRARPCLNYQMNACLGPCCMPVNPREYGSMVEEVVLFLSGRTPLLIKTIKADMLCAAAAEEYERAAFLRDKMFALEKTLEKQVAVSADVVDRDVVATAGTSELTVLTILFVRSGYIQGLRHFVFRETMADEMELMEAFVRQFYETAHFIPGEILLSVTPENMGLLEEWLQVLKGKKVRLLAPKRGEKALLVQMTRQNAEKEQRNLVDADHSLQGLLDRLQAKLHLPGRPERIECFDNSHLSGSSPVAGMVVYQHAKPAKSAYRKFRIRTMDLPDDYAAMAEVLKRRFGKANRPDPLPDLLLVDGGRGQLGIATTILKELSLEKEVPCAGIAKKEALKGETEDKIYLPGRTNPIQFGMDKDLLLFLQQIRDETHRFALAFHKQQRTAAALQSELDEIPGIGAKRKKTLLQHFGSVEKIRAATPEEIGGLPGMNQLVAVKILELLHANHRSKA